MMKILTDVWEEIIKGKNLDLYIMLTIAIITSILEILGVTSPGTSAAFIVPILAFLAIAMLGNRHHIDELVRNFIQSPKQLFFVDLPSELQDELVNRMAESEEIFILGVNLGRTLELHYKLWEQKLREGASSKGSASKS